MEGREALLYTEAIPNKSIPSEQTAAVRRCRCGGRMQVIGSSCCPDGHGEKGVELCVFPNIRCLLFCAVV